MIYIYIYIYIYMQNDNVMNGVREGWGGVGLVGGKIDWSGQSDSRAVGDLSVGRSFCRAGAEGYIYLFII